MELYEVEFVYPARRVATVPGGRKTAWKYKRVQFTVKAANPVRAAELVTDHMMQFHEKHAASCRLYVSHVANTPGEGIKFSVNGNEPMRYAIRKTRGEGNSFFPIAAEDADDLDF